MPLLNRCGSVSPHLQSKVVTPTTATQIVLPDSDYDGLSQVTVGAMEQVTSGIIKPQGDYQITLPVSVQGKNVRLVFVKLPGGTNIYDYISPILIEIYQSGEFVYYSGSTSGTYHNIVWISSTLVYSNITVSGNVINFTLYTGKSVKLTEYPVCAWAIF
jgi:hypothetical protein